MRPPKAATKTTKEAMNWTAVHTLSHTGTYKHMHALGEIAYPSPFASSNNSQAQICKKVTKPITTMVELPSQTGAQKLSLMLCCAMRCHAMLNLYDVAMCEHIHMCVCVCVCGLLVCTWPTRICMFVGGTSFSHKSHCRCCCCCCC